MLDAKVLAIIPEVKHPDAIQIARALAKASGETVNYHDVADSLDRLHGQHLVEYNYAVRWFDGWVVYKLPDGAPAPQ